MLFVMHFGWYLRLYFGFFTSETVSGGICDAFQIFGCGGKKINIKTGGLPPALWFRFYHEESPYLFKVFAQEDKTLVVCK